MLEEILLSYRHQIKDIIFLRSRSTEVILYKSAFFVTFLSELIERKEISELGDKELLFQQNIELLKTVTLIFSILYMLSTPIRERLMHFCN